MDSMGTTVALKTPFMHVAEQLRREVAEQIKSHF